MKKKTQDDVTTRIAHKILEKVRVIRDSLPTLRKKKTTKSKTKSASKSTKKTKTRVRKSAPRAKK